MANISYNLSTFSIRLENERDNMRGDDDKGEGRDGDGEEVNERESVDFLAIYTKLSTAVRITALCYDCKCAW